MIAYHRFLGKTSFVSRTVQKNTEFLETVVGAVTEVVLRSERVLDRL